MDPAWVVSVAMLALAIGMGFFAIRSGAPGLRWRNSRDHLQLYQLIQRLEERIKSLEEVNDKLRDDLEGCERERVRLMEMLVSPGDG